MIRDGYVLESEEAELAVRWLELMDEEKDEIRRML